MLNEETRARKIELIAKLQALANGDPNSEEARSAAKMAGRLMAKYGLAISDITTNEEIDVIEEVIPGTSMDTRRWESALAAIVAKVFDLKLIVTTYRLSKTHTIKLMGTPNDLEIGVWFYKRIRIKVGKLSEARRIIQKETNTWQEHYAWGLVCGVGDRLSELYAFKKEAETPNTTDLVVIKNDAVEKYYNTKYPDIKTHNLRVPGSDATVQGYREGQKLNLNQPLNSETVQQQNNHKLAGHAGG